MDKKLMISTREEEDLILADIGYSRKQMKADLKQLKEWLKQQHYLPPSRLTESDNFFQWFLIGCKGSMEKTKRKLDNYYTVRSHCDLLAVRDPTDPEYLTVRNICHIAPIPHAGFNGNRLSILRFGDFDPDKNNYHTIARIIINIAEMMGRIIGIGPRLYLLLDCKGITPAFVLKMHPSVTKDLMYLLKEASAARIMKLAVINTPSYFEIAVNTIIIPFLTKKLRERCHVTSGGCEDLLNYFSPEVLPSDYGGLSTNPTLKDYSDMWKKCEQDNRDWFINELSEHTDESKRIIIDGITQNPYFGVHGSLKKLVVD